MNSGTEDYEKKALEELKHCCPSVLCFPDQASFLLLYLQKHSNHVMQNDQV